MNRARTRTGSAYRCLRFCILFLLICADSVAFAQTAASPPAAETTVSLTEYRSRVAAARKVVAASHPIADENAKTNRIKVTDATLRRVANVRFVAMPDGSRVAVGGDPVTKPLANALDSRAHPKDALTLLETTERLLAPTTSSALAGDAHDEAAQILTRKEFVEAANKKEQQKSWLERQIQRALEALGNWFGDMMGRVPSGAGGGVAGLGSVLQWLFYFVVAIATGVALAFLSRSAARMIRIQQRRRIAGQGSDPNLAADDIADPLARARQLAAEGQTREAVRLAYIAALRRLRETGLLVLEANKTNWEYQRALRGRSPAAHDALLPATRIFDRIWYGQLPPTSADFENVLRAHDALPKTVAETTPTSVADMTKGRTGP